MSFTPETLLRHWQTLRRIPRYPQKITAGDICQHLHDEGYEVGKRTVERDLHALSRIFPLVLDERAKPYGWSWSRDAAGFDLPGMTVSESLTVMMAKEHLRSVMPASTLEQMAPYFRQAEQNLNTLSGRSALAAWFDKVRIIPPTQPLLAPQVDEATLSVLQEGLLHNRQCAITYQRRVAGDVDEYPVNLLGLVQRGVVLYLVCTIKMYTDLRILALHRVLSATMLDTPTAKPKGFKLDDYLATCAFGWTTGILVRFEALFTPEAGNHLCETPLSEDQAVTVQEDGKLKVTATIHQNPQLVWWLLGFGADVEVIAPVELRSQIAEKHRTAASIYD
ncbi:helix-turn-helix transcriptional regulator [Ferrovum myxofaciens]|uniref:helix-turn-helix transcriptional regulator n=1 Tax=Ferrovum myxofaciens TaxID=416213 RepID=UPI0004E24641|nr:WYL domain-containing protein [Ferrovum myxofaciens]